MRCFPVESCSLPRSILTLPFHAGKSSTGWDTGRLFIGSEGTLGIITSLTVRLAPLIPLKAALTSFPNVASAVSAVVDIIGAGLSPTSLELLDGTSIRGMNLAELLPYKLEEEPTVMMRFSSPLEEVVNVALDKVKEIVARNGGRPLRVAKDDKESNKIWGARKVSSSPNLSAASADENLWITDSLRRS